MIQKVAKSLARFIESTGFIKENPEITIEMVVFGCNILISTFLGWAIVLILSLKWGVFFRRNHFYYIF